MVNKFQLISHEGDIWQVINMGFKATAPQVEIKLL
jgi:hypothetical protein